MDSIWLEVVLIAAGIVANGFFAGSETALISARISRLAQLRQDSVGGAETAMRLKEAPEAFLATIQIAITAIGTLASAVGGAAAVGALTPWLIHLGVSAAWAGATALALIVVAITYCSLVIGELVPKAIALRDPERSACRVAPLVDRLSRLAAALVRVLTASTDLLLRVLGLKAARESAFVSEEEVRYLVREGAAKGIFEKFEDQLVQNVFEFADTTVREILIPRERIQALDIDTPPGEVLRRTAQIGHTRVPVYRESIERPVGILVLKDLLRAVGAGRPVDLAALVRPPLFVPETTRISLLLRQFQRTAQGLALVVDEYGTLVGLVTVEDVLEEIVGALREEGEGTSPSWARRLADGAYELDGLASVRDVRAELGLPIEESDAYQTIAGLLVHALGAIPKPGAIIRRGGYRWTVIAMTGARIARVRVEPDRP